MMLSTYSSTVLAVITLILSLQCSAINAQEGGGGGGGAAARRDKLKASAIFPTGLIGESADGAGGGPGSGIRTTIKKRNKRRKLPTTRERPPPKGSVGNNANIDALDEATAEIDDKAERRRQRKEQRRNRRALMGKGGRGVSSNQSYCSL